MLAFPCEDSQQDIYLINAWGMCLSPVSTKAFGALWTSSVGLLLLVAIKALDVKYYY